MAEKKGQKVVVGFSGSLDSVVAAYLLKKQGFEVIAIGLSFFSSEVEELPERYDENGKEIPKTPFMGVYQIGDLEKVKKLADAIGVTFYAVQAANRYQNDVTDFVVGSRLGGRSYSPKVAASKLIFNILEEKAAVLGADKIATGHYAKVVRNKALKAINVFVSNDLENDQSYLLSSLEKHTLEKLVLPLSDMRVIEVGKIAKSLNLSYIKKGQDDQIPLMRRPGLGGFVADRAPRKMFKEGNIIDFKNDSILGDHGGIHNFGLGDNNIRTKGGTFVDNAYTVIGFKYSAGIVYCGYPEDLRHNLVLLMNVKYAEGIDLSRPLEVFVKSREKGEKVPATLMTHNNGYAEIQFKEMRSGLLFQGEFLAFYNRAGAMGRILGGGEVRTSGYVENGRLRSFPKKKEELEDDEQKEFYDIYSFTF